MDAVNVKEPEIPVEDSDVNEVVSKWVSLAAEIEDQCDFDEWVPANESILSEVEDVIAHIIAYQAVDNEQLLARLRVILHSIEETAWRVFRYRKDGHIVQVKQGDHGLAYAFPYQPLSHQPLSRRRRG
jgi:hypothetical protein